ncbi:MAG: methyltransferase domain-containing protein [Pirellulaceae bacterium]
MMKLNVLQPSEESAVYRRYAAASQAVEPALCCPVQYSTELLNAIPTEVLERDYGCGDPTPYVRAGETVLDLGSGGGKLCFIASQVVGPQGRIIGIDCNASMMQLARGAAPQVAENIGYANVDFRFGLIQDLRLNLELLGAELKKQPVADMAGYLELRDIEDRLRREQPLVPDASVDCVLSNCVLNLVKVSDRRQLFAEIFRVLKLGGRAAISDIVADKDVPEAMQRDPELWSGCISGAFQEDSFLHAFRDAGFADIQVAKRESEPWKTLEGIEFRSLTVVATKGLTAGVSPAQAHALESQSLPLSVKSPGGCGDGCC